MADRRYHSNADLARHLGGLAQQLQAKGENPFKIRAYRRAAQTVAGLTVSVEQAVRSGADLTRYPSIGKGIASALRELVFSGKIGQLELLLSAAPAEVAALSEFPGLDPKLVRRAYKKFGISSVEELQARLEAGEVGPALGWRMERHLRTAMAKNREILLDDAEPVVREVETFLLNDCGAQRVLATGNFRRRTEVVSELSFLVECPDFEDLVRKFQNYGGGTELVSAGSGKALFKPPIGLGLTLEASASPKWGVSAIRSTGSGKHLERLRRYSGRFSRLAKLKRAFPDEVAAYAALGLSWIPPELREGNDEVELAAAGRLPVLVSVADIKGDLHAHTTASDGVHSIEEMADAARELGYQYLGITDHSQSLKIAHGVPAAALWKQIRRIDRLNAKGLGIRILKSAEVDILADGSLDYPDDLLAELDYTVCSIHSRFRLPRKEQTERLMRAMDNRHFSILGHATGRLVLHRPGYEIDWERLIPHARRAKAAFEINADPDRLDLSAENARQVRAAGIKIAIGTDAHRTQGFGYMHCGVDVARRAGLEKRDVLNCLPWPDLARALRR